MIKQYQQDFLDFIIDTCALRFGDFTLKSGRRSPYFFNAGLFNSGAALKRLGEFYADAISDWGNSFDMLFGPAYKGIPLVTATAIALADRHGVDIPYAFNRKEAKPHGEGGTVVGAPLAGRVVIVDDVVSAGLSVGMSVELIRQAGAKPVAVFIALDRQERDEGSDLAATQAIERRHKIQTHAIVNLSTMIEYLQAKPQYTAQLDRILDYRHRYGVTTG